MDRIRTAAASGDISSNLEWVVSRVLPSVALTLVTLMGFLASILTQASKLKTLAD
jgi:hypothetical protein